MTVNEHFSRTLVGQLPSYITEKGAAFFGDSRDLLATLPDESVDLIMTSPPFALLRKKEYGNEDQAEYVSWLGSFALAALPKLKSTGSLVMDIGGAYQKGSPTRSLYPFRVPIHFCDDLGYFLAEDFYWFNSSKLPSPIEWVNKRKIRAKDSVNNIWWFSKTEWPKANVSKVLTEYSERMKKLLQDPEKYYDPKKRPSGHDIGKSFGNDNGGAIPSNLLQIPNSESGGHYTASCKEFGVKSHPARFPKGLPEFFIKYLTEPGDLVMDIFAGSNTTGEVAESLGRRWLSCDADLQYVAASSFRFLPKPKPGTNAAGHPYNLILENQMVDLRTYNVPDQLSLTLL
ncbi:site-specific DNA-methyltransferase [Fibrella sp. WM1]|uniref:DNA-methyltransferase n=1 Tax=Fibrella musci TaxID=3242485 RepID=UPI003520A200